MPILNRIVVHYDEIGLKAANRGYFERLLISNMKHRLGARSTRILREQGQISVTLADGTNLDESLDILRRIPGIAYLSPAAMTATTLEAMGALVLEMLHGQEFSSFKIYARRHDKTVPMRSMEINRALGGVVLAAYPDKKVRMTDPDAVVKVEVTGKGTYVSTRVVPGVGGMPTRRRQRVVTLLSGGLDSPVAAYLMMKRGCEVVLAHFQNQNQMTCSVEDKIVRLGQQLSRYQVHTRLYIVPFEEIQNEIVRCIEARRRMLVYRRVMLRLSTAIAAKHKARFLVVGDSLSQVASQTYENLAATYAGSPTHVFSPLIGLDKKEITRISRDIGTFDISALPYGDCCSYFLPKHPELRGTAGLLHDLETQIDLQTLGDTAIAAARLHEWD